MLECFDMNGDFDDIKYLKFLRYIESYTKYLMNGKSKEVNPHWQATSVTEKRKRGTNTVCQYIDDFGNLQLLTPDWSNWYFSTHPILQQTDLVFFRRRFRIPYANFCELVQEAREIGSPVGRWTATVKTHLPRS